VHNRMPVILDSPGAEAAWLDPGVDLGGTLELVRPLPDGRLEVYAVSPRVNNAREPGRRSDRAGDGNTLNRDILPPAGDRVEVRSSGPLAPLGR
jgi:hypothetical protein